MGQGHGARECGKGMGLYETRVWDKSMRQDINLPRAWGMEQGIGHVEVHATRACGKGIWKGQGVRAWDTCLGKGHGVGICGKGKG